MKLKKSKYFDVFYKTSGWTGGDGVYTHIIDDTIIWYFSDTFVGEVDEQGLRKDGFVMKNHSFGYAKVDDPFNIEFIYPQEREFLQTNDNTYHWLMDGMILEDYLYLMTFKMSGESFGFQIEGIDTFKIPLLHNRLNFSKYERLDVNYQKTIGKTTYYFGVSILDNKQVDGFIYIFGVSDQADKKLVVLRTRHFLSEHVEYLTPTGWSRNPKTLKPILKSIANELRVYYENNRFKVVYSHNGISNDIMYSETESIEKGFKKPIVIYEIDGLDLSLEMIGYNAKIHLLNDKKYVTYHVNTYKDDNHRYAKIYYPRVLEVEV